MFGIKGKNNLKVSNCLFFLFLFLFFFGMDFVRNSTVKTLFYLQCLQKMLKKILNNL
jgi:hypothetical protein